MRTLQVRGYVEEVARDPGPGQAVLYGTSRMFLERLGLDSLDDLPPLAEFVPGPEVMEALEQGSAPKLSQQESERPPKGRAQASHGHLRAREVPLDARRDTGDGAGAAPRDR